MKVSYGKCWNIFASHCVDILKKETRASKSIRTFDTTRASRNAEAAYRVTRHSVFSRTADIEN